MTSVQYEIYVNEDVHASAEDIQSLSDDDEDRAGPSRQDTRRGPITQRQHYQDIMDKRWPLGLGVCQCVMGFITALLGVTEVVIIPLLQNPSTDIREVIKLNKANLFGMGMWIGALMVLSGATGIRAYIYRSISTVYFFFSLTLINLLILVATIIIILTVSLNPYKDHTLINGFHSGLIAAIFLDLVLALMAFIKYYEDVFCGEMQLCRRFMHCCFPCFCPRAVSLDELLEEAGPERPPSLPV